MFPITSTNFNPWLVRSFNFIRNSYFTRGYQGRMTCLLDRTNLDMIVFDRNSLRLFHTMLWPGLRMRQPIRYPNWDMVLEVIGVDMIHSFNDSRCWTGLSKFIYIHAINQVRSRYRKPSTCQELYRVRIRLLESVLFLSRRVVTKKYSLEEWIHCH